MKKIAFISTVTDEPWAGSEELWSRAAASLREAGVDVEVSVCYRPTPIAKLERLEGLGCRIHDRHHYPSFARSLPRRVRRKLQRWKAWTVEDTPEYQLVARWLSNYQPELVVISQDFYTTGLEWMELCSRLGLPYVLIIQAVGECIWPRDIVARDFADAYERARCRFFVSEGNVALASVILATPLLGSKVIRNPFNVSYDATPPWPSEENGLKLACVGRLHPMSKGQDILLDVLRAEKWKQRDLSLTFFGDGPNRESLLFLKQKHGLSKVDFGGHTSDIESIWATHHALVLASRFEGLPLAIVEAMLCGRMCIVTDVAGNAELLQNNISGFVAAAPAAALVDEALERAWERKEEWRQIGASASRRVRELVPRDPVREFTRELRHLLEDEPARDRVNTSCGRNHSVPSVSVL